MCYRVSWSSRINENKAEVALFPWKGQKLIGRRRGEGEPRWERWFWMLELAEVAKAARPLETAPDAGPYITHPHPNLQPCTQGGV